MAMIVVSLSAIGQEQLLGINGTYAEMVRKYSYVMNVVEKGNDYTTFLFDKSSLIIEYRNRENEGVEKIVSLEYVRTKAEGFAKINRYRNSKIKQGLKPFRYKELNGDIVYAVKNKYFGKDYCHSEILAVPKRVYDKKGYNYLVYTVNVPTI